jgi:serine protease AprX
MPGADPFVITVGSLADNGTVGYADDRESIFSSRGPTRDGFAKPDVLAPGEHIVSLRVPGTALDHDIAGDPASAYARLSGTSAATAIVTGAAALLLEDHAAYTVTQVKGALVASGRHVSGSKTPALDVDDALHVRPERVNSGLAPSLVLVRALWQSGNVVGPSVGWDGISWEGISWEAISWEGVAWEAISWEGVTWDSVTWELR